MCGLGLVQKLRLRQSQYDCSFAACSGRVAVAGRAQPEPIMTLPRTAAQVLSGHVRLEIRCIDRVLLDLPPAAATVRAGHPRVLLPPPREAVRVLRADAADDRAVRCRHPPLHRLPRPGTWSTSPRARARTRSPGGTWPATTAGSRSCSPGSPRRRPGSGGPGSAGTR